MWEKLYSFGKDLLTLKGQVEKNTADIKELRQDLKDLTSAVDNLARVVQRNEDRANNERDKEKLKQENLVLQLKNALLEQENRLRLLPGKSNDTVCDSNTQPPAQPKMSSIVCPEFP
jgi:chromosome segregation ATPase